MIALGLGIGFPGKSKPRSFVGRLSASNSLIDFTANTVGGSGGKIQSGDLGIEFGMRTNATVPSIATGWTPLFPDYSNATPWQVLGWWKRLDGTETDPMPSTHSKLLLVYRNCAIGTVSTLSGTGTTASVPALTTTDWAVAFLAARAAQSDMSTAMTNAGLTSRRSFADGATVNSHAAADSGAASTGFAQLGQTITSTAWFGASLSLVRA